jgi:hypothetical protein
MSERATYITNYIFCRKCLTELESVLPLNQRWKDSHDFGYISGILKAYYPGEEYQLFEETYLDELILRNLCHEIQIALIPEDSNPTIYLLNNNGYKRIK